MESVSENNGTPQMPPEMWNAIFSNLEPMDLLNVTRTCKEWEAVLELKKPVIYFQNVLPMLGKHLSLQSLLGLRGTCKDLKTTVDKMVESSIDRTKLAHFKDDWSYTNTFNPTLLRQLGKCYTFPDPGSTIGTQAHKVHAFLEGMGDHPGNPFIGRSVRFQFAETRVAGQPPSYSHQSSEAATELLSRFGKHLTHFTHFIPCSGSNTVFFEAVTDLPLILVNLPNLQSLFFDWKSEGHDPLWNNQVESRALLDRHDQLRLEAMNPEELDGDEDEQMEQFPQMRDDELPQYLANLQFPSLPNLTTLHYDFNVSLTHVPLYIGLFLLRSYGRQITTFICIETSFFNAFAQNLSNFLPNLKHLRINDADGINSRDLCTLRLPFLEQLEISCSFWWALDGIGFMRVLDHFSNTLVYLQFDMDLLSVLLDKNLLNTIQLPNLKHLSIRIFILDNPTFWHVIPPKCKGIQRLDLRVSENLVWQGEDVLQEQIRRAFQELPKLEIVYVWAEGRNEPLTVLNRSTCINENEFKCDIAYLLKIGD